MKNHLIGFTFFVLVAAGLAFLFPADPLESDARLVAKFERQRSDLENLVAMMSQDSSVETVYRDFVLLSGNRRWDRVDQYEFSNDRWEEYQQAFAKLKDLRINRVSRKGDAIIFGVSSAAFHDTDNSYEQVYVGKGLLFTPQPLESSVPSLDHTGFELTETRFRQITKGWYLYRESGISKPE